MRPRARSRQCSGENGQNQRYQQRWQTDIQDARIITPNGALRGAQGVQNAAELEEKSSKAGPETFEKRVPGSRASGHAFEHLPNPLFASWSHPTRHCHKLRIH